MTSNRGLIGLWRRVQRISRSGLYLIWGWEKERDCLPEDANAWLARFERDEPNATFRLSVKRPRTSRVDEARV